MMQPAWLAVNAPQELVVVMNGWARLHDATMCMSVCTTTVVIVERREAALFSAEERSMWCVLEAHAE